MNNRRRVVVRRSQEHQDRPAEADATVGAGQAGSETQTLESAPVRRSQIRGAAVVQSHQIAPATAVRNRAAEDAAQLLSAAQQQAEALLAEAQANAAAISDAAQREGFQAGQQEGHAAVQTEMRESLALVRQVAGDVQHLRDSIWADSEQQLLQLVAGAATRVCGELAQLHPEIVEATVRAALERAGEQSILRIRVHPDSQGILETRYGPDDRDWELRSDPALALGGCIIDTEAGVIDASIEGQIAEIEAAWRDVA